ncbi:ecto-ADP-ribosyltransferase 4-like [Trachinotus anak]|uniref:ecto-ADP-ribosyltransferase 4-like n=1 Tax=Trachinotus anak TaxID=443729 RepID=UPI0039F22621
MTGVIKSNMLTLPLLPLLLCWMLPVGSKKISIFSLQNAKQPIQLNMVEDAVDDMYFGCNARMADMISSKYFTKENTGIFEKVWKKANECAIDRLKNKDTEDAALTLNHTQAICVYTGDDGTNNQKFYKIFNDEIRTNRKNYCTSFSLHSLHFWLTSAIQILSNKKNCITTYRRTTKEFTGEVNQTVRFGSFTSSSFRSDLTKFGKKTCFKITTCSGAFLKKYPQLKDKEQEVLIPPYEMFIITKKIGKNKFVENLNDCELVYVLKSAGEQSNLNCHAIAQKISGPL